MSVRINTLLEKVSRESRLEVEPLCKGSFRQHYLPLFVGVANSATSNKTTI